MLLTTALALVFFYAPNDADQGFVQKIFYVHVPLAIVALIGFVVAGVLGAMHLRTRDDRWDYALLRRDPHERDLRRRRAGHRRDLGARRAGASGGCGTSRRWSAS